MTKTSFNLSKFRKIAFNDGAKGAIHSQTRCMMNCYKGNMINGKGAQESWQSCVKEYNEAKSNSDWYIKYAAPVDEKKGK